LLRLFSATSAVLGLVCIAAAVLALLIWIPLDIETGLIEKVRRQTSIGDSLLPTLACGFVLVGGLFLLLQDKVPGDNTLASGHLRYLLLLIVILGVAFTVMRWLGPAVVWVFTEDEAYRPLRDTAPWKYLGYVAGGTILVSGLMALGEGRVTLRSVIIGLLATLALIAIYDLPFDDLLLPPNGDV